MYDNNIITLIIIILNGDNNAWYVLTVVIMYTGIGNNGNGNDHASGNSSNNIYTINA